MVSGTLKPSAATGCAERVENRSSRTALGARSTMVRPSISSASTGLPSASHFPGAKIWLQPLTPKKLSAQWHIPAEMFADCREMFANEDAIFVLRISRHAAVGNAAEVRKALEFEIDISKRCCYLNLDHNQGSFTAEIGLRCSRNRYVFIARSTEVKMLTAAPSPEHSSFTPKKITSRPLDKPHTYVATPIKTLLSAHNEIDWEWRDLIAEEQTSAVYKTFIKEGPRVLRQRSPILPTPLAARKVATIARRVSPVLPVAKTTRISSLTSSPITPSRQPAHPAIKYPLQAVSAVLGTNRSANRTAETIHRAAAAVALNTKSTGAIAVKSHKLTDALVSIRDKAEIILRGKVKKIGQRVRVGGLLIEPDADGSFCVACVIRGGKLFVPVVEVEAARV